MSRYTLATACLLFAVTACAPSPPPAAVAAAPSPPPVATRAPYALSDTEVLPIHSQSLRRDYELFVALPESYATQPARHYPVLFVTDANYAFPLVRAIRARVGDHGAGLEDFILVGLSYSKGDTPAFSRRRDYTPTAAVRADVLPDASGRPVEHGGAEAYRLFLRDEVFPLVARTYRADMQRTAFAGHSYGSLLGAHVLLTEPAMFRHYILGSPSLWFDRGVMFEREASYAKAHDDLPADVYLGIGAYERVDAASGDPRYSEQGDMVGDLRRFERALRSRGYPGLRVGSDVIEGEDHLTVAPILITRGLLRAFPPRPDGGG